MNAAEQASDLTLGGAAVDRLLRPLDASLQARQGGLDALAEARVHRLFLLLSLSRTHQKERLAPIRAGADLGFDPVAHLPPVPPIGKGAGELLQLALLAPIK